MLKEAAEISALTDTVETTVDITDLNYQVRVWRKEVVLIKFSGL